MKDLNKIEKAIGFRFKNKKLLKQAVTHYSCFGRVKSRHSDHYERLEFLGDSILGSYISQVLFENFPSMSEEELTNLRSELTSNDFLAEVAHDMKITGFVRFSDEPFDFCFTERSREGIHADAVEAIIGAIFVDRGEKKARKFITKHILPRLADAIKRAGQDNPKSALQKLLHQKFDENPVYEKLKETGRYDSYRCEVGVYAQGKILATGKGINKKEASENAAEKALLAQLSGE